MEFELKLSTTWSIPSSTLLSLVSVFLVVWFLFAFFSEESFFFLAWPGLGLLSFYLSLQHSWDGRFVTPWLTYFVEMGGFTNYLLSLTSNHNPPDLYLLSSWDYLMWATMPRQKWFLNENNSCLAKLANLYISFPMIVLE
jgi:hypothetical protein